AVPAFSWPAAVPFPAEPVLPWARACEPALPAVPAVSLAGAVPAPALPAEPWLAFSLPQAFTFLSSPPPPLPLAPVWSLLLTSPLLSELHSVTSRWPGLMDPCPFWFAPALPALAPDDPPAALPALKATTSSAVLGLLRAAGS